MALLGKKTAMAKAKATAIESGVNATKKEWAAQLKTTQAELQGKVDAYKTTGKYAYESGKAAALTASADARLAAAKRGVSRSDAGPSGREHDDEDDSFIVDDEEEGGEGAEGGGGSADEAEADAASDGGEDEAPVKEERPKKPSKRKALVLSSDDE